MGRLNRTKGGEKEGDMVRWTMRMERTRAQTEGEATEA